MERILTYQITGEDAGLRIEQYLRRQGYSLQKCTKVFWSTANGFI